MTKAFVGKKPHLIQDADNLFQQLQQTRVTILGNAGSIYPPREDREIDFALERGLCSLLVGDVDGCRSWLGIDNDNSPYRIPSVVQFIWENSKDDDDGNDLPGLCKLLETWLMEVVFPRFRDSKDIQFKLGDYYDDPLVLRYLERLDGGNGAPLAAAAAIVRIGAEATAVLDHVKASAIQALQKVFPQGHRNENITNQKDGVRNHSILPAEFENPVENLDKYESAHVAEISGREGSDILAKEVLVSDKIKDVCVKITCAGAVIGIMTLFGMRFLPAGKVPSIQLREAGAVKASDVISSGMLDQTLHNNPRIPRIRFFLGKLCFIS